MSAYVQVVTTVSSESDAETIAHALVESRLAACAQIEGPIRSVYQWQGKVESETEWRLAIKTRSTLFSEVEAMIRRHHDYDVPEIIVLPIEAGGADYLEWLDGETRG